MPDGPPPFDGRSVLSVLTKVVLEEPPRLGELQPDLPSSLDEAIAKMLAKDPAHRLADGAAVLDALDGSAPSACGARSSRPRR